MHDWFFLTFVVTSGVVRHFVARIPPFLAAFYAHMHVPPLLSPVN